MTPATPNEGTPLPRLRPELRIYQSTPQTSGAPGFVIHDPFRHRFFQIDQTTRDLLELLARTGTREQLTVLVETELALTVAPEEIDRLVDFLFANELTCEPKDGGWRFFATRQARQTARSWHKLAHQYLFFRVPLVRPQAFLLATYPLIAWVFSATFAIITALCGAAGLYLVSRQWADFIATFSHFFSWEGLALFAIALVVVKAIHELAHAYVAVRYGCVVPTMGVAFMLLTPLPYTDVTDTWRLRDRRKRLAVDGAGVSAELTVAAYATFLWAFLPEGPAKSVAFMLATVGWIMSLLINLNPFMRFDGYYILSELTGIENLQSRAFAVMKWWLREKLFALAVPCPERFSRATVNWLVLYAAATAIYRLFLYIGIAILVYQMTFKVLGLLLFIIEIVFLVLRPVLAEIAEWWKMREQIGRRRHWIASAATLAAVIGLMIVPWSTTVTVPAVIGLTGRVPLHARQPAQVASLDLKVGATVEAGHVLARLTAPELDAELQKLARRIALIELRLGRRTADSKDRAETIVLQREHAALITQRNGLMEKKRALDIRAPARATILEVAENLHAGRWINTDMRVALLGHGDALEAIGYLSEADAPRVGIGTTGVLVPDDPLGKPLKVRLVAISATGADTVDVPELTSEFGGRIAVERGEGDKLVPKTGVYRVKMKIMAAQPVSGMVRGVVHLNGRPESFAAKLWRQTLKVLAREAGA